MSHLPLGGFCPICVGLTFLSYWYCLGEGCFFSVDDACDNELACPVSLHSEVPAEDAPSSEGM